MFQPLLTKYKKGQGIIEIEGKGKGPRIIEVSELIGLFKKSESELDFYDTFVKSKGDVPEAVHTIIVPLFPVYVL